MAQGIKEIIKNEPESSVGHRKSSYCKQWFAVFEVDKEGREATVDSADHARESR